MINLVDTIIHAIITHPTSTQPQMIPQNDLKMDTTRTQNLKSIVHFQPKEPWWACYIPIAKGPRKSCQGRQLPWQRSNIGI